VGELKFRSKPTVIDRFQEAGAECSVNGDRRLDDSRGERLTFVAHDNDAPREIAKARKYETTKKVLVANYAGNLA
jgi:hypothetical protein